MSPFVSQSQRRWMYENKPAMAKEWESHTTKGRKLPEKVKHKTMKSSHSIHKHTSAHDKMSFVAGTKGVRHVGASGKVEHKTMEMGDHE